ncbi:MAG: SGNH/GDSL hydrolase family protein [Ilumatobacter sp.]|uniref:SGNH/GDSL hydrolase family protein n=1 Tax=Ilumatobacter sp. TaxID=1967498 RepID=UPI00329940D5
MGTERIMERRRDLGRRLAHGFLAVTLLVPAAAVAIGAASSDGVAEAAPVAIDIPAPGPLGAVTVFGDSVLLGSALYGPTLPDRLAERGWGPIRFRAGEGYNTRSTGDFSAGNWFRRWRAEGWDAPNVLVNLGANDSGICVTDFACARTSIQRVIDEIGPGHRIWWPQITRFYTKFPEQENWNRALRQFADERSDFTTWDWPAELSQYPSPDGTHLSPDGYRARSVRMAEVFTRDMARGTRVGGDAVLPSAGRSPSTFVSLPSTRIVDTRSDGSGPLAPGTTRRVDFADAVPDGTTAVALYLGSARATTNGFFTATPCGETSDASTVNYRTSTPIGAPTIVALGTGDDVCVSSSGASDLVVDLQGAFTGSPDGLTLTPLGTPRRLVDTRGAARPAELVVAVPAGASAVAVNLTAVRASENGFLSAYPCGTPTEAANLNFRTGGAWAASAIVQVSDDDTICVRANVSTDIAVDITGTFGTGPGLRFVPVAPTRAIDTRDATGGWGPIHGAGQTFDIRVAPPDASAVTGTLTIVNPFDSSFVSAEPCAGSTATSSANAGQGAVIANSVTVGVTGAGRLCLTASTAGHTLFDTTGWWVP